ncbi:MAG: ABC transporter permease [Acetobacterales bacterium]
MKVVLSIALAHLRNRIRQTAVSVLGVATGVGFFIAVAALMEGSQRDFVETIVDATPHVVISDEYRMPPPQPVERVFPDAAIRLIGVKPKDELRGIRNPNARVAALDALPGVSAAPTLRGQVVARFAGQDVAGTVVGIDPRRERNVSQLADDMTAGRIDDLYGAANGVILGNGFIRKLGISVGDTMSVSSPTGVLMKMKVVGSFRTGVVAIDDTTGYALLKKVQVLQDRPNVVNEIRLRVDDIYDASALARSVEARYGYKANSWDEANEDILRVLEIRNMILYSVVLAILVVAGFGIFNIVSTVTFEKVRDIAILKSLGFQERDIRRIFVVQGAVVGAIGAVIGWVLGFGLCRLLGSIEFEVAAFTEVSRLPLYEAPVLYLVSALFALVTAVAAAWLPARRAARVNPVDIIRGAA